MPELAKLNPKKFGFGLMRLPEKEGIVDLAETQEMIDLFLSRGFTYFDTAYPYHGGQSERVVGKLITPRYDRDRFTVATKMPVRMLQKAEDAARIFSEQLERTGLAYFDFYLLHALAEDLLEKSDTFGVWDFAKAKVADGSIRHFGISFHDTADVLERILIAHPEIEFVQLQINYVDWDSETIQARKCSEVALKYGKEIIVMEPLRGGMLADFKTDIRNVLDSAAPRSSPVELAFRYVFGLDGIITVLSGMSTLAQMRQNLVMMEQMQPLTEAEKAALQQVVEMTKQLNAVPCTACGYCTESCPVGIQTPSMMRILNNYTIYGQKEIIARNYSFVLNGLKSAPAKSCLQCGACMESCPQKIDIISALKSVSELFDE